MMIPLGPIPARLLITKNGTGLLVRMRRQNAWKVKELREMPASDSSPPLVHVTPAA